ncbi:hypothetical protein [Salinigranum salinum]|uniref:hypothetical protein n=1 Tax=Salinigranum salinum TaxID=1364937 RepID=UPI0012607001|nr:hypothetical protein [Salinigranum salinum]
MDDEIQTDGGEQGHQRSVNHSIDGSEGIYKQLFTDKILRNKLVVIVSIYVITGLSIGLAGFTTIDAFSGGSGNLGSQIIGGIFVMIATVFTALIGVPIAIMLALRVSDSLQRSNIETYATTGVGVFLGHLVMFSIAFVILASKIGNASVDVDLISFFIPMLLAAAGVAFAGVSASYLTRHHGL